MEPEHVGIETFDDLVAQVAWSHHWSAANGRLTHHSAPYRYISPFELVLMARITGFELEARWGDWNRSPFTSDNTSKWLFSSRRDSVAGVAQ